MMFLVLLAAIGLIAITATIHAVHTDGYRQIDSRRSPATGAGGLDHTNEGTL